MFIVLKYVVSVLFMLLQESFAKKVTLYLPLMLGIVKEALYFPPVWFARLKSVDTLFGYVMFACTVFTQQLSVTIAAISIVLPKLKLALAVGANGVTDGFVLSIVKFVDVFAQRLLLSTSHPSTTKV
ncbi:Uncharacterised protein [uncultured archaeon]|nr:Uncharacterised protein [uncultured archaeon]